MKKIIRLIGILLIVNCQFSIDNCKAQAPSAIPYQAVARDSNGNLISNQTIALRFSIHDTTSTGTIEYQEVQTVTTNEFGLFSVNIGQGTVVSGSFANITWGISNKFTQVEMDASGGNNFSDMGTQQMLSVPYALYSAHSNDAGPTGATGANGNDGAMGATGVTGATGNDGAVGATGATGNDGAIGATGATGNNGIDGATGATGATGIAGNDGATGATGANGATGNDGATGATGAAGANGNDGATGPTGATGAEGIDGATGATGAEGAAGTGLNNRGDWVSGTTYNVGDYVFAESSTNPSINSMWIVQNSSSFVSNTEPYQDLTDWVEFTAPEGPTGATGTTGATGLSSSGSSAGNTPYWNGSAWVVNSSTIYNDGGNVGINTSSPTNKLTVSGNSDIEGYLGIGTSNPSAPLDVLGVGTQGTAAFTGTNNTTNINFGNDGTEDTYIRGGKTTSRVVINDESTGNIILGSSSCNVAIGTSTPSNRLTVSGNTDIEGNLGIGISNPTAILDVVGVGTQGTAAFAGTNNTTNINYGADGTQDTYIRGGKTTSRVVINDESTGNIILGGSSSLVGIGTSSPSYPLHIKNSSLNLLYLDGSGTAGSWLHLNNSSTGGTDWRFISTGSGNGEGSGGLLFQSNAGTRMFINSSGNVGIGTTSQTNKLEVAGTTKTTNLQMTSGATNGYVLQSDASGNASWVNSTTLANGSWTISGNNQYSAVTSNVGIGSATPSQKLDATGNINLSGDLYMSASKVVSITGGSNSLFLGQNAGGSSTGDGNIFVGKFAGNQNTSGNDNTITGYASGSLNTTGTNNSYYGHIAGHENKTGSNNVAIGDQCLYSDSSGNNNVAIGVEAGNNNQGSGNVFIGFGAGYSETGSDKLYIANNNTSTLIYGDFSTGYLGIGTTSPYSKFANTSTAITASDGLNPTSSAITWNGSGNGYIASFFNSTTNSTSAQGLSVKITGTENNNKLLDLSTGSTANSTGTTVFRVTGNGNAYLTGNMSIGTTSSDNALDVSGRMAVGPDYAGIYGAPTNGMIIEGKVGIGTSNPDHAYLDVEGTSNVNYTGNFNFVNNNHNSVGNGTFTSSDVASIYGAGRVMGSEFDAVSDARIKHVLGRSNNENDLTDLMKIQVTDYTYIDTLAKGNKHFKKVIAQEVEKICPNAINLHTDFIPDVYKISEINNGFVALENANFIPGDKVKLIFGNKPVTANVICSDEHGFLTDVKQEGEVFIYGREVNDFHTVDYEALSMLNVSATQALVKRLADAESQLKDSNLKFDNMQQQLNTLSAKIADLINKDNTVANK